MIFILTGMHNGYPAICLLTSRQHVDRPDSFPGLLLRPKLFNRSIVPFNMKLNLSRHKTIPYYFDTQKRVGRTTVLFRLGNCSVPTYFNCKHYREIV